MSAAQKTVIMASTSILKNDFTKLDSFIINESHIHKPRKPMEFVVIIFIHDVLRATLIPQAHVVCYAEFSMLLNGRKLV